MDKMFLGLIGALALGMYLYDRPVSADPDRYPVFQGARGIVPQINLPRNAVEETYISNSAWEESGISDQSTVVSAPPAVSDLGVQSSEVGAQTTPAQQATTMTNIIDADVRQATWTKVTNINKYNVWIPIHGVYIGENKAVAKIYAPDGTLKDHITGDFVHGETVYLAMIEPDHFEMGKIYKLVIDVSPYDKFVKKAGPNEAICTPYMNNPYSVVWREHGCYTYIERQQQPIIKTYTIYFMLREKINE